MIIIKNTGLTTIKTFNRFDIQEVWDFMERNKITGFVQTLDKNGNISNTVPFEWGEFCGKK